MKRIRLSIISKFGRSRNMKSLFIASIVSFLFTALLPGANGALQGVVHDPQHRPVPGAQVLIRGRDSTGTRTLQANANGEFRLDDLAEGAYQTTVSAPGLQSLEQEATVTAGKTPVLHFRLELAEVHHAIEVSGAASKLNTQTSTVQTIVSRQEIARTAGADQTNSLAMITDFTPGAYMVHDMLHMRGGHQVNWFFDGIPVQINTNIAANVGYAGHRTISMIDYTAVKRRWVPHLLLRSGLRAGLELPAVAGDLAGKLPHPIRTTLCSVRWQASGIWQMLTRSQEKDVDSARSERELDRTSGEISGVRPSSTKDLAPNLALPWVIRLRYGMVVGEATIVLAMAYAFHLKLPLPWTLAPLVMVLGSNILLARMPPSFDQFPQQSLSAVFCLDTLCLTVMLGLTGGPMNPFSLLYLVQITLSAVVLRKAWTWALGVLSTACFGLLFFFHAPVAAFQTHLVQHGQSPHLVGMWIAFVVAAALISFFTGKIADALRTREQEVLVLQDQVAKNERLASLVTLAAGAAHELGTPLGTIAVVARELERYAANPISNETVLEDARLIRSEVERCRRILERMSVQSAEPMGETPIIVRVRDIFIQVIEQFSELQRGSLKIELADAALAAVLPKQAMAQSLAALIQNALDANFDQRPIVITAPGTDSELRIAVRDHGHGMPANVLRRIAEPFFTTKEPGKGMGLGTFLVRTFAESLGGRVLFDSVPGEGTTVTLDLPLHSGRRNIHAAV